MAARRSWLRTRQSICSLLPCRRLPDHIRAVLYRREMKMSESWISCSVSCGTSMFGLLWSGVGGFGSLYVILHRFRDVSRWHSRGARWGSRHGSSVDLTVGGTGNMHRHLAP